MSQRPKEETVSRREAWRWRRGEEGWRRLSVSEWVAWKATMASAREFSGVKGAGSG